ncbi:MAG: response regulator transcription factor [Chloroflexota bacterium]
MIRVTIVSPNPALRVGLRELLSRHSDIRVVADVMQIGHFGEGEASADFDDETEVLLLASVSAAHITQMDFDGKPVLLLTDSAEGARALLNSPARAWGVLSLNATEDELAAGIRAVAEGLWVGAAGLMSGLMRDEARIRPLDGESLSEPLTAREKEVLQLMAEGMANKQIALSLGISEHTVKFHLSSLYTKLNVSGRTEAVRKGLGLGLISI